MQRLALAGIALSCALGNPLIQPQRPPQQTIPHRQALKKLLAPAAATSQAARPWVLDYLENTVRPALVGTSLETLSANELLQRMDWEFRRLPLMHNGPLSSNENVQISDDTDLQTSLTNGYLQNVCQRWVLGTMSEPEGNLLGEHAIMVNFMALPEFQRGPRDPTLREANSCVMYLANNLRKTSCGNFMYGSVTYVVNPILQDKFAIAPFDTGAYSNDHQSDVVFGTLTDYYHVFKSHVSVLNYNFADVLKRWWVPGTPPPAVANFPYFEVEWFGNAWLPESMLYLVVKFSGGQNVGLWGTTLGQTLQQFMRERHRPLIWADGDDSGMLIDPTVNNIAGGKITQADIDLWQQNWGPDRSFQVLYALSPNHLKFQLPNYDRRSACEGAEGDSKNMVIGTDLEGGCVYWIWQDNPTRWECLNTGGCVKSDSDRGSFFNQDACLESCGKSKWACVRNVPGARPDARHCRPSLDAGQCPSESVCLESCTPAADGCLAPAPPPPPPPPPGPKVPCSCLAPGAPCPTGFACYPCSDCECGTNCEHGCPGGQCYGAGPGQVVV